MKYRKKPVIIDAEIFDGINEMPELDLTKLKSSNEWFCQECGQSSYFHGNIKTLEGYHIACPGDYIITGVEGEHYPCKSSIFKKTYEPIIEDSNTFDKINGLVGF